jgi:hypothetical protein
MKQHNRDPDGCRNDEASHSALIAIHPHRHPIAVSPVTRALFYQCGVFLYLFGVFFYLFGVLFPRTTLAVAFSLELWASAV